MIAEFDSRTLAELASDLDVPTTQEIIASYLVEAPKLLRDASQTLQSKDVIGFRRAVHTLKSTSANMGALRLADACRALEADARDGVLPSDASAVDGLERLFEAVRGRLASWSG